MSVDVEKFIGGIKFLDNFDFGALWEEVEKERESRIEMHRSNMSYLTKGQRCEPAEVADDYNALNTISQLFTRLIEGKNFKKCGYRLKKLEKIFGSEIEFNGKQHTTREVMEMFRSVELVRAGNGFWYFNV